MTAFIITRIQTGDYERWRPMYDQDKPRAHEAAITRRVLRAASTIQTRSYLTPRL